MSRGETMKRVRAQTLLVRRLGEQIREKKGNTLASPRIDGMPRAMRSGMGGLDVGLEKREALQRILDSESTVLREYEKAARREMEKMKPDKYAFCALYYIAALSLEETGKAIDRSARQCARYKQEIEQEDAVQEMA